MGRRSLTVQKSVLAATLFLSLSCNSTDRVAVPAPSEGSSPGAQTGQAGESPSSAVSTRPATVPRIVRSKLLPASPRRGDELLAEAEADTDSGEPVKLLYAWSINGHQISTAFGASLKTSTAKGDSVSVIITPERAGSQGMPLTQTVIVGNSPPVVRKSLVDSQVSKNHFQGRASAEDPDGDPLSFTLLKGPKGMTVNQQTGELSWDFEPTDEGSHELSISVKDSDNAEVILNIPFKLGPSEKVGQK